MMVVNCVWSVYTEVSGLCWTSFFLEVQNFASRQTGCLCDRRHWVSDELFCGYFTRVVTSHCGRAEHVLCDSIRKASLELGPGFLPTPHWAHFPSANFAWNPFTVVNLSLKYDYTLSLWVLLGNYQKQGWSWDARCIYSIRQHFARQHSEEDT